LIGELGAFARPGPVPGRAPLGPHHREARTRGGGDPAGGDQRAR
jgi:hypothetical protein